MEKDITAWIENWNQHPKPFAWTKTADEILNSLADYLAKIARPAIEPIQVGRLTIGFYLYRVRYMGTPKMTMQTKLVLRLAMQDPSREWYGLQMIEATGLPAGTIYPIIARLERHGWLESRWEDPAEHVAAGRPRRRYYRFTPDGLEQAQAVVGAERRPSSTVWQPTPHITVETMA